MLVWCRCVGVLCAGVLVRWYDDVLACMVRVGVMLLVCWRVVRSYRWCVGNARVPVCWCVGV